MTNILGLRPRRSKANTTSRAWYDQSAPLFLPGTSAGKLLVVIKNPAGESIRVRIIKHRVSRVLLKFCRLITVQYKGGFLDVSRFPTALLLINGRVVVDVLISRRLIGGGTRRELGNFVDEEPIYRFATCFVRVLRDFHNDAFSPISDGEGRDFDDVVRSAQCQR